MIKFQITIDGVCSYETFKDNSCDALIDAKERHPDVKSVSVKMLIAPGMTLIDRLTGERFTIDEVEPKWVMYRDDNNRHALCRTETLPLIYEIHKGE